jgi:hypothetical protein
VEGRAETGLSRWLGHAGHLLPLMLWLRADDGTRTRDPHLGKVMRYQLRYVRMGATGRTRTGCLGRTRTALYRVSYGGVPRAGLEPALCAF